MNGSEAQHDTKHAEIQDNFHHTSRNNATEEIKQRKLETKNKSDQHKGHQESERKYERLHHEKKPTRKISVISPTHTFRGMRKETPLPGKHSHKDDRTSVGSLLNEREIVTENNYKAEPECVFEVAKTRTIIYDTLKEHLADKVYDPTMNNKCRVLSEEIRDRIKGLSMSRFKIVSIVTIGEKKKQSMLLTSRCLWNKSYDNFVSATYIHNNFCATGMVFVAYAE